MSVDAKKNAILPLLAGTITLILLHQNNSVGYTVPDHFQGVGECTFPQWIDEASFLGAHDEIQSQSEYSNFQGRKLQPSKQASNHRWCFPVSF